MLSDLPRPTGLDIAARYCPAAASELVGGDWYDAFPLLLAAAPETLAIVVGDVAGHDSHAATGMGQLRAMLRQTCWDHQAHDTPAAALTRLDHACHGLRLANASAILGYLCPLPDGTGRWSLTWSNAGHPPPVLVLPDRTSRLLDGGDVLLGCADLVNGSRRDHRVTLDPGSTLVFYTDGLVERRGRDLDVGLAALARLATEPAATAADHIEHILTVMTTTTPAHDDDVVILAVRIR
jgi:serine phosphatase RsbU (regulator of sigma subunit)